MMSELEFKSLVQQGYNRIPLLLEAFADLETPLSLYLKLAFIQDGGRYSFLLESVVGGERFGRYSFIGLPARTLIRASGFGEQQVTEVVTDGQVVESSRQNPLDFIAAYQQRFKVALRPGLPRFCGGLAGYFGYDAVRYMEPRHRDLPARCSGLPRYLAAAVRGAGGDRQPVGQALSHRLCRPGAAGGFCQCEKATSLAQGAAAVFGQCAAGATDPGSPGRA